MQPDLFINWREYYQAGVLGLGLTPESFWKLTFAEFWALYDGKFGKTSDYKPMTMQEYRDEEKRWVNGNA